MRGLLISQYFLPDITAVSYRMNDLINAFKEIGIDVSLVTSYPIKNSVLGVDEIDHIYRVKLENPFLNGFFKYAYEYVVVSWKIFLMSKSLYKSHDFILVTSPPMFLFVPAYFLSVIGNKPLILDIRDIWPGSAVSAGMLKKNSLLYRCFRKFEVFMYKKASSIICVSYEMKKYIEQFTEKRVSVIYNGIDKKYYFNPRKRKINIKKKLIYFGNLGKLQCIMPLLDAVSRMHVIDLEIIGDGINKKVYEEYIKERKITNIIIKGAMEKTKLFDYVFENADFLYLSIYKDETLERTIPSKLFDYLLFNIPIIYGIEGEGKQILDGIGCGIYYDVDHGNLEEIIINMVDKYSYYNAASKKNSEILYEKYDRVNNSKNVFNEILIS